QPDRAGAAATSGQARQYLIAVRPRTGFASSRPDALGEMLQQMEEVEVVRRLHPRGFKGLGAGVLPGTQEIIVARMDEKRADALRQSALGQVVVEPNARLFAGPATLAAPFAPSWSALAAPTPRLRRELSFRVVGGGDQPLAGAGVTLFGRGVIAQAITDTSGAATVALFDAEADLEAIRAVHVQPAADHWESFALQPMLAFDEANVVRLKPIVPAGGHSAGDPHTAEVPAAWARRAMHLDRPLDGVTPKSMGAGVKIALIDSGCDHDHLLLRHISRGADFSGARTGARDWTRDEIGQGTHCAGIIAGSGRSTPGVEGIAPGAEIHVFKLTPGGRFSDLIEALDQCMEREIDIVHLGVGAEAASELVAHKLAEARLAGVACIAAAGDSGGPVQFPAFLPGVLSVGAVGRLGEFPSDTHHGWTAVPDLTGLAGVFAANFSGAGPQLGVCAPGVAVISSVPGGGVAARDGTAIAAAHVAGFAAVVLAHHPLFRGVYRARDEARVRALFELIVASAAPPVLDLARVGAGLPDLRRVPGLGASEVDRWNEAASAGVPPPACLAGAMALMQLRAVGLF
ncbi:MAG: Peptidase and in, kexin, sedolisin, partial [Caulobacteraceae bacterium]|nr:Peptidase and in, kexin, sedolisin [Caulobacteraceae bacterium]